MDPCLMKRVMWVNPTTCMPPSSPHPHTCDQNVTYLCQYASPCRHGFSYSCPVPVVIISPVFIHMHCSEVTQCGREDVKIQLLTDSSIRVIMPSQVLLSLSSIWLVPVVIIIMPATFIHTRLHAGIVPPVLVQYLFGTCGNNRSPTFIHTHHHAGIVPPVLVFDG